MIKEEGSVYLLGTHKLSYPQITVNFIKKEGSDCNDSSTVVLYGIYNSPIGEYVVERNSKGISALCFTNGVSDEVIAEYKKKRSFNWVSRDDDYAALLFDVLLGKKHFDEVDLCISGTPFQIEVWKTLLTIPFGKTITYGKLAELMGRPNAVRAVASAVAKNKFAYIIPCHRVVRSDGSIGNYRWGGAEQKSIIIEWEKKMVQDLGLKLY